MTDSLAEARVARAGAEGPARADGPAARLRLVLVQLLQFGVVGGIGFVIDTALFNLLILTVLSAQLLHTGPLIAKALSALVAIAANWLGNRLWTFRSHRRRDTGREGIEFFAVSLAGLALGLVPLLILRYLLGIDSLVWDNIANLLGLGLGSVFRFALYRWWVFSPRRAVAETAREGGP